MTAFWFFAGEMAAIVMMAALYRRTDIIKLLTGGLGLYFAKYILISGVLIWAGGFSIDRAALWTFIVCAVTAAALLFTWTKGMPHIRFIFKPYIPLFVIMIVCGLLSANKAGLYSMGQDSGVYQARAMFYMAGYNDSHIKLDEIQDVNSEWGRTLYLNSIKDLDGFYLDTDIDSFSDPEDIKEIDGVLHGVATYPALLALFSMVFGFKGMLGVNSVAYLLLIANVWFVCTNMKFNPVYKTVATALAALSPIVLWGAQNTLPDLIIALLFCAFMSFLSEGTKKRVTFVSAIPLAAMCFFHVQISIFMPMFVIIYLMNYLRTKHKGYLSALIMLLIAYPCGMMMMLKTATRYVDSNLGNLYAKTGNILNADNLLGIVITVSAVCAVIAVLLLMIGKKASVIRISRKLKKSAAAGRTAKTVLCIVTAAFVLLFAREIFNLQRNGLQFVRITFAAVLQMSAYVMLPLAFVAIIYKGKSWFKDRFFATLSFTFMYLLFMYCVVVMPQIYYFYYSARYLSFLVILPILIAGYMLDKIRVSYTLPLVAAGAIPMLLLNTLLVTDKDLTYSQFELLDGLESCITDKDAVLINSQGYKEYQVYWMPLKALTGADIYFVEDGKLDTQARRLGKTHENVFVLSYDAATITGETEDFREVYKGTAHGSVYEDFYRYATPYPRNAVKLDTPMTLFIAEEKKDR